VISETVREICQDTGKHTTAYVGIIHLSSVRLTTYRPMSTSYLGSTYRVQNDMVVPNAQRFSSDFVGIEGNESHTFHNLTLWHHIHMTRNKTISATTTVNHHCFFLLHAPLLEVILHALL